ncbi:MAG: LytTR family transcriptional regulator DNA-binding domain-containing protein [Clostridia bacterium]|nr:LytTR family transcriptional regulator DNA-binding domain-containing protein [Clostridia bacterium]
MRIKLKLNPDRVEATRNELTALGIEISETADLILTEENYNEGKLLCRKDDDRFLVSIEDIIYIETLGKDVFVYTENDRYSTAVRLYVLERTLPAEKFIRISNSVIINRNAIKKIRPALSQKFYLTLKNDAVVDVTRSYYIRFKDYYGI